MSLPSPPTTPPSARWRRVVTLPLRVGPYDGHLERGPFLRLALLHACSSAGDALVTVALAGSVFVSVSLNAARGRTALGLVCTVLPFVVVGPLLGPRIDCIRGGRRLVACLSCLGRAVACLAMARVLNSLLLFPAAFFSLVSSKTYLVAKASLVPGAVACDDDLVTANSRLAVGSSVVTSVAALIGAGIYRLFGSGPVLYLDVVVLVAGAALAPGVRPARPRPLGVRVASGVATSRPGTTLGDQLAGAAGAAGVAGGTPVDEPSARRSLPPGGLTAAAITMASMRAVAGLMTALVIFAFRRDGAPLIWYGLVGVASVGGNLGGAAIAPRLRTRVREERLVPGCAVAIGVVAVALIQMSVMHRRPAALLLGATVGVGASVAKLAFDALVQREVPDSRRSRRFATYETVFQLSWVLAALVPVLLPLSLGYGFLIVGLCTLGGATAFWWGVSHARARTLPSWWPNTRRRPGPRGAGRDDFSPRGPHGEDATAAVAAVDTLSVRTDQRAPVPVGADRGGARTWASVAPATVPLGADHHPGPVLLGAAAVDPVPLDPVPLGSAPLGLATQVGAAAAPSDRRPRWRPRRRPR